MKVGKNFLFIIKAEQLWSILKFKNSIHVPKKIRTPNNPTTRFFSAMCLQFLYILICFVFLFLASSDSPTWKCVCNCTSRSNPIVLSLACLEGNRTNYEDYCFTMCYATIGNKCPEIFSNKSSSCCGFAPRNCYPCPCGGSCQTIGSCYSNGKDCVGSAWCQCYERPVTNVLSCDSQTCPNVPAGKGCKPSRIHKKLY